MTGNIEDYESNFEEKAKILNAIDKSNADKHATLEEFQNFMHRVVEIGKHSIYLFLLKNIF